MLSTILANLTFAQAWLETGTLVTGLVVLFVLIIGIMAVLSMFSKFYRKVGPEEAIIRSGRGGLKSATGEGIWVIPVLHMAEHMDLSVKRIEIPRKGASGLICKDNVRADIEVAFFTRVNNTREDILQVAQALGCRRASDKQALVELFDAKFSEALKTVGKHFDFVELYTEREKFKEEILRHIGTDLNGYILDDCAIDYLEQTPVEFLNPQNILDAEGIKKITDLTAREHVLSNSITREKEKTIKKQDVEASEAIYQLERQRVEAEEQQKREIASITAREEAAAKQVEEEERLRSESARIKTQQEIDVAEENRMRQTIVAAKSKERTDAVESERVKKDQQLEQTEREKVVGLADIEKEKAIEVEKRNIQDVIRERVVVERAVVEEEQRIKDTEEFATADRRKKVAVTLAEQEAQESLVKRVKEAEAERQAAEQTAEQIVVEAEAQRKSAEKEMESSKMLAEATRAQEAASGLAEAEVISAKATAKEKDGLAEASVIEKKAVAEAKGQEAKADAIQKEGTAEATVMQQKFEAEATGIEQKAEAMKLFDGVGREHEEFKLRLNKDKDIEIAAIDAQARIADFQSKIVSEALRTARIDIVGGETEFFDKIVDSIKSGKAVDRFVNNSETISDIKNTFFNGNPDYFTERLGEFVEKFNVSFEDVKDLSVSALIFDLLGRAKSDDDKSALRNILDAVRGSGDGDKKVAALGLGLADNKN
ncbi:flotillin family protein [Stratiformator vulcanicus]|uniref:Inner membrane protein YqiK n=1 Tax=Stratiformator vulcanicus TaxID=2527980 RepID=A0A517R407_9PLAN|nr:flotillin family protein [Stratiformator vulcanicus]QDT38625.1 Inner membrane protein YqiK [Stratiformator vulcanicus]